MQFTAKTLVGKDSRSIQRQKFSSLKRYRHSGSSLSRINFGRQTCKRFCEQRMIAHSIFLKCGEEKKTNVRNQSVWSDCGDIVWQNVTDHVGKGRYCFAGDLLWKRTCQEMIADQFIGKKQDLFDAACKSVLEVNTLHFTDSGFGCQLSFNQAIYLFGILGVFNTITFRHVCQPHFWYSIEKYTAGKAHDTDKIPGHLGQPFSVLVGQRQSLLDENFNLNAVPGGNCSSYLHGQFVRETLSWPNRKT